MFTCVALALVLAGEILDPVCSAVQPFTAGEDVKTARVAVVGQNGSVILRCPSGTSHSWYKLIPEKQPVALNDRFKEVSDRLLIMEANVNDAGRYLCVSDTESLETILTVAGDVEVPGVPHDVKIMDKSPHGVELSWAAPYDGKSFIQRYQIEYKSSEGSWESVPVPGLQNEISLTELRPATIYYVRIVAVNQVGSSVPSDTIRFITDEDAPGGPPTDVRVEAANSRALNVWWKPPERALWNGRVLGYKVGYKRASGLGAFIFQTVGRESGKDNHLEISELKPDTRYWVTVEAFNKAGSGPGSDLLTKYTAEDVPEQPPRQITCKALTSQRIRVSWAAPHLTTINGVLKGYKVIYGRSDVTDENRKDVVVTASRIAFLDGLHKYTNYSVQVLAYTAIGDGPLSDPIQCQTEEDLPDKPANIKVIVQSDSVLVIWKPPTKPNGILEHYTLYFKQASTSSYRVQPTQLFYEVTELDRSKSCEIYVTASTYMGEGEPSTTVLQSLTSLDPAILLFDDTVTTTLMMDVTLLCPAVGVPPPETDWKFNGGKVDELWMRTLPDGSLSMRRLMYHHTGEYSCHVKNQFGEDSVTYKLIVQGEPPSPRVTLLGSTGTNVTLKIQTNATEATPVQGYIIYYNYQTLNLTSPVETYTLQNLLCGNGYEIYARGYNSIGRSEPSVRLITKISGSIPIAAEHSQFVTPSSRGVSLHLDSWSDGGCPISNFKIRYKQFYHDYLYEWNSLEAKPGGDFHIENLKSSCRYKLEVTATNSAGFIMADYDFETLAPNASG